MIRFLLLYMILRMHGTIGMVGNRGRKIQAAAAFLKSS